MLLYQEDRLCDNTAEKLQAVVGDALSQSNYQGYTGDQWHISPLYGGNCVILQQERCFAGAICFLLPIIHRESGLRRMDSQAPGTP